MIPQRPKPETRESIERALNEHRRKRRAGAGPHAKRLRLEAIEQHLAAMRDRLSPLAFERIESQFRDGVRKIGIEVKRRRNRRRGDEGMPVMAEPPRGPKPHSGGAAAALEFDE